MIGKSGSTIKGLRDQYGCSVMIPALDIRGPERIITIKAANYNLIGKIVARCAEHLDEFLRRSIPIRYLYLHETRIFNFFFYFLALKLIKTSKFIFHNIF